ncbi:MAG: hypothetical protein CMH74_06825, partial [Nitrospina sp.]|nr:hypothetical protein [Nitrospina sp.]
MYFFFSGDKVLQIFTISGEIRGSFQLASPLSSINRRFDNGDEEKNWKKESCKKESCKKESCKKESCKKESCKKE